ncbi:hypothetical protein NKG94_02845 [Micromonospora sp. M12]
MERTTGYTYKTDSKGRVTHFSGRLQLVEGNRNPTSNAWPVSPSARRPTRAVTCSPTSSAVRANASTS